jgi:hypothetical protein
MIFVAGLELNATPDRTAVLDKGCAGNKDLRR